MKKLLTFSFLTSFILFSNVGYGKQANQVYRIPASGSNIASFGALNLSASAAVTGTLPVVSGGTGTTTSTGTGSVVLSTSPTFTTGIQIGSGPIISSPSASTMEFLGGSGSILQLNSQGSSGNPEMVQFINSPSSGKYNFAIANQQAASNHWEVIPSTTTDGTTFSAPSFWVDNSGNINASTSVQIGSGGVSLKNSSGALQINSSTNITNYASNTLGVINSSTNRPLIVSAGAPTNGLMIVRGTFSSNGTTVTLANGEGWGTLTHNGVGDWSLNFSASFGDTPVCICSTFNTTTAGGVCQIISVSSSSMRVESSFASSASGCSGSTCSILSYSVTDGNNISISCSGQRPSGS